MSGPALYTGFFKYYSSEFDFKTQFPQFTLRYRMRSEKVLLTITHEPWIENEVIKVKVKRDVIDVEITGSLAK